METLHYVIGAYVRGQIAHSCIVHPANSAFPSRLLGQPAGLLNDEASYIHFTAAAAAAASLYELWLSAVTSSLVYNDMSTTVFIILALWVRSSRNLSIDRNSNIPVPETQTHTEIIDSSKTHTKTETETTWASMPQSQSILLRCSSSFSRFIGVLVCIY